MDHNYVLINAEDIRKDLEVRKYRIEKLITRLKKRINAAPPGFLRITKSHNREQFCHTTMPNEKPGTYISCNNQTLPAKLAQKDYDTKLLEVLKQQHKTIDRFLKDFNPEAAKQVYEKLMTCQTVEELNTFINGKVDEKNEENSVIGIKQQIADDVTISLMLNLVYSSNSENYEEQSAIHGEGCSFAFLYMKWLEDMGYYSPM